MASVTQADSCRLYFEARCDSRPFIEGKLSIAPIRSGKPMMLQNTWLTTAGKTESMESRKDEEQIPHR
jgi:hypothetical protein